MADQRSWYGLADKPSGRTIRTLDVSTGVTSLRAIRIHSCRRGQHLRRRSPSATQIGQLKAANRENAASTEVWRAYCFVERPNVIEAPGAVDRRGARGAICHRVGCTKTARVDFRSHPISLTKVEARCRGERYGRSCSTEPIDFNGSEGRTGSKVGTIAQSEAAGKSILKGRGWHQLVRRKDHQRPAPRRRGPEGI
jgi:hypothetical protein